MTDPVTVLREALDKATEGPWEIQREGCECGGEYPCGHASYPYAIRVPEAAPWVTEQIDPVPEYVYSRSEISEFTDADVDLIVAARNLLPVLLDEVEALRKVVADVRALHVPWYEVNGVRYEMRVYSNEAPEGHVCVKPGESPYGDECNAEEEAHYVLACAECRCVIEDEVAGYWLWPCDTARLLAVLDKEDRGE